MSAESTYERAKFLDEHGPVADALPLYEQVVQERPNWADPHHSLGWLFGMKLGRFPEGIEHLTLATQLEPDVYSHLYVLGAVYMVAEQWQEAKVAFQQCLVKEMPPAEEYVKGNVAEHMRVLNRRLKGDFRPVYPRRRR